MEQPRSASTAQVPRAATRPTDPCRRPNGARLPHMPTDALGSAYFAEALEDRKDITDQYEVLGDLPRLVGVSTNEEDRIVDEIRKLIENDGGGSRPLAAYPQVKKRKRPSYIKKTVSQP